MRRIGKTVGLTIIGLVIITAWIAVTFGLGELLGALDGRGGCDRPVDCEVSPQDAWQPH